MNKTTRAALACAAMLVLAACSGSGKKSPGGGTPTASGGFATLQEAVLARQVSCFKLSTREQAARRAWRDAAAASYAAAVTGGRLSYSQANADACASWVDAASCVQLGHDAWAPACDALFAGVVANGGACGWHDECASGFCVFGSACPGVCNAYRASGAVCEVDAECGPGRVCVAWGAPVPTCQALTPAGGSGQPCSNGRPRCPLGYYCEGTGPSAVCRPTIAAGGACDLDAYEYDQCVAGTGCVARASGGTECAALVGEGQSCAGAPCGTGLTCAPGTNRCVPLPILGEDCTATDACADRSFCLGTTRRICTAATAAVGQPCSVSTGPTSDPTQLCAPSATTQQSVWCVTPADGGTARCTATLTSCD